MRRKNKKKSILLVLLMLIAGISMGYAILNTTLNINGTSKIKDAKWNIYWDNPQVTAGSVTETKPTIDSAKTTATFDITLNNPKDFYEFTIDAVNAGTIDAMIKVNGVNNKVYSDSARTQETTLPTAISYTVTYADGTTIADKHLLAKKSGNTPTRETYKVRVEFRNDEQTTTQDLEEITEETTYYMTFSVEYVQAENAIEAHPVSAITYITRQNEGQITPGDVIGIGDTEDFYVISSDSNKTVLLSKYNLLIEYYISSDGEVTETYDESVPGYGLQNVNARGYAGYEYGETSMTQFCYYNPNINSYWMDSNYNLLSKYTNNDTIYFDKSSYEFKNRSDDSPAYPYIYDENSAIYTYVNDYKNRLIEMGAPNTITGRLLSYEEANANKEVLVDNKSIIFNGQNYWLGSASGYKYDNIWIVEDDGDFQNTPSNDRGLRPVIEIPTSELQ